MAGPSPRQHVVTSPLSPKSHDPTPNGRCNYANLNGGVRCGCQRFSDQAVQAEKDKILQSGVVSSWRDGFCMCEHHACFHEFEPAAPEGFVRSPMASLPGSFRASTHEPHRQLDTGPQSNPAQSITHIGSERQDIISQARRAAESDLPDTMSWNRYIRTDSLNTSGLLPIPQECIMGSQSSADPHPIRPTRFQTQAGRTKNPQPGVQPPSAISKAIGNAIEDQAAQPQSASFVQSVTDIITPSPRASPDLGSLPDFQNAVASLRAVMNNMGDQISDPLSPNVKKDLNSQRPHIQSPIGFRSQQEPESAIDRFNTSAELLPHLQTIMKHVSAYPSLKHTLYNLEYRIDHMENGSVSNPYMDEVNEKLDVHDTKFIDVENRVEDLEKSHAALIDGSHVSSPQFNQSALMDTSQVSELMSTSMGRSEWISRFESLESQVTSLQSALPSHSRPWEVEVIFLPFGPELKGIWSTLENDRVQRSRSVTTAGEEWTQQFGPSAASQLLLKEEAHDDQYEDNAPPYGDDIATHWLSARACARGSRVEERLRSRGFVKTIHVKGPEFRDVHAAINLAFEDLPDLLADGPGNEGDDLTYTAEGNKFMALQAPWIPLRKFHKDSRLRFLQDTEMVTPALWSVQFLSSTVVMKSSGIKRLFVTHRQSYLQHLCGPEEYWTWKQLRELPRSQRDLTSGSMSSEPEVSESCWDYDERLDPAPSPQASFSSHYSSLSIRQSQRNQQRIPSPLSEKPESPSPLPSPARTSPVHESASSPVERLGPTRPSRPRTSSLPAMTVPIKTSSPTGLAKRRIASFIDAPPPNLTLAPSSSKRARVSRSPSRPRDTPRWSVGPPSPYVRETTSGKRGTTPFAYATPHSNTPYFDFRATSLGPVRIDDVDDFSENEGSTTDDADALDATGSDTDLDLDTGTTDTGFGQAQTDEEWFGVADDDDDDYEGQEHNALTDQDTDGSDGDTEVNESSNGVDNDDDARSEASEAPSEYPSTHAAATLIAELSRQAMDSIEELGEPDKV